MTSISDILKAKGQADILHKLTDPDQSYEEPIHHQDADGFPTFVTGATASTPISEPAVSKKRVTSQLPIKSRSHKSNDKSKKRPKIYQVLDAYDGSTIGHMTLEAATELFGKKNLDRPNGRILVASEVSYRVQDSRGLVIGNFTKERITKELGLERSLWHIDQSTMCIVLKNCVEPWREIALSDGRNYNVLDGERVRLMQLPQVFSRFGTRWRSTKNGQGIIVLNQKQPTSGKETTLLTKYLEGYSKDVREYVLNHLHDTGVDHTVARETKRHPERYGGIEDYERIKLKVTALVNIFLHHDEDLLEELMSKAHLFVFDDDAWWAAYNCLEPLARLPYSACIVSDERVLLYRDGSEIKALALADGADVERARRLMSFVVNDCHRVVRDESDVFLAEESAVARHNKESMGNTSRFPSSRVTLGKTGRGKSGGGTHASPVKHHRRGHWRNQAYGPGMRQHRRIWINETIVTPGGTHHDIRDPKRIHRVSLGA